jgi:anti-sigma B factor antagonist
MSSGADQSAPVDPGVTVIRQLTDAIVCCNGRITSDTTHSLKAIVKPLFSDSKRVVLDLTNVSYVDSSGLGTIVGLYISAKVGNCQLKIIYSNETVTSLFRLTKLDQLLTEQT